MNMSPCGSAEPTFGFSQSFAVGFMFLNAWEPSYSPQFAGWRVLPHLYAPESWGLPVRLGFVASSRFRTLVMRKTRDGSNCGLSSTGNFEHWQVVFNPVLERALHGPGIAHGWNFEPALLLRCKRPRSRLSS